MARAQLGAGRVEDVGQRSAVEAEHDQRHQAEDAGQSEHPPLPWLVDDGLVGFDLYGKTIGVIGTGRIGAALLRIMHGFGWGWHRDHHEPHDNRLEKNDRFALVGAAVAGPVSCRRRSGR